MGNQIRSVVGVFCHCSFASLGRFIYTIQKFSLIKFCDHFTFFWIVDKNNAWLYQKKTVKTMVTNRDKKSRQPTRTQFSQLQSIIYSFSRDAPNVTHNHSSIFQDNSVDFPQKELLDINFFLKNLKILVVKLLLQLK